MAKEKNGRDGSVTDSLKRGAEAAANGVHHVTNFVARNDERLADGAQAVTHLLGRGLDKAGQELSATGKQASKVLHGNASRAADAVQNAIHGSGQVSSWRKAAGAMGWMTTKAVTHAAGWTADAVNGVGKAAAITGRLAAQSAPVVGGALGGVVRGAAEVASNAVDAAALPASRIEAMRAELRSLGQLELERSKIKLRAIESAQKRRRKDELLDLLVVGGITLGQALRDPASVPAEVERAFSLAYPGLAQSESFSDSVSRMSSGELLGLTSAVKGKLFELGLVDHLNAGGLPDGFHAELADSATQAGWDIQITDAQGNVSDYLQAKATESVSYVKDALERYPDIDVSTTTEVHAQLVAMGLAQNLHNSGISEAMLQAKVEAAAQTGSAFDASDLVPSSLGLAVIALSVFMNKETSLREKGAAFGTRSAKAGVSSVVGKVAMVATQTWWLGLIAGVGSSWLAGRGHGKRERYEGLKAALESMRKRQQTALPTATATLQLGYEAP
jgi:hypothetical protein